LAQLIVCRCVRDKHGAIDILRWLTSDNKQHDHGLTFNSIAWLRAENGDPLICVTGNMSQIRILNVKTGHLVNVCVHLRHSLP
jgi:polycomb protein EED